MPDKKCMILCEHCGWKRVCSPDSSGLHELNNDSMSSRKFRCPGCGRAITPRPAQDPQSGVDKKRKEERANLDHDEWMEKSVDFQRRFIKAKDEQDNNQGN